MHVRIHINADAAALLRLRTHRRLRDGACICGYDPTLRRLSMALRMGVPMRVVGIEVDIFACMHAHSHKARPACMHALAKVRLHMRLLMRMHMSRYPDIQVCSCAYASAYARARE